MFFKCTNIVIFFLFFFFWGGGVFIRSLIQNSKGKIVLIFSLKIYVCTSQGVILYLFGVNIQS